MADAAPDSPSVGFAATSPIKGEEDRAIHCSSSPCMGEVARRSFWRRDGGGAGPRPLAVTFIRFLLVGAANTGVGFGVILALQFGLGASPHLANAGGYAVGLIVSFTLNRRFVFARGGPAGRTAARFGAAALAAFGVNQGVLWVADRLLGPGSLAAVAAQALAAASYTATLFALCRGWVFRGGGRRDKMPHR